MLIPQFRPYLRVHQRVSQDHFRLGEADIEHMRAQNPHFMLAHFMHFQGNNRVLAVVPSAYTRRFLPTPHARNPMLEAFGQPHVSSLVCLLLIFSRILKVRV